MSSDDRLTLPLMSLKNGMLINAACKEAQDLADLLGVNVPFVFNAVRCEARPGGDAATLVSNYWDHDKLAKGRTMTSTERVRPG